MDLGDNPTLTETVNDDTELKHWLINYVGDKYKPEDEHVTVEMIVSAFIEEFPEFLMAIAEENWVRGYHQALVDIAETQEAGKEEIDRVAKEYDKATEKVTVQAGAGIQEQVVNENTD